MSDINQKVNLLRSSLKAKMPYSYPLEQHPIIGKEEYVQKLYFDVLCVVAQYENKDMENQLKFIQRIMAGAGRSEAISEHIKNAMEITEETFEEFLKQCKENALTDIFIVDGLLIACAGGVPNEKQMEFMSEIACAFGMRRNYLEWMTGIVKAILEQDTQEYTKVCQQIPHDAKKRIVPTVICYLKDFVSGVLVDTDDMLWIYSKEKRKIDIKALFPDMKISRKKVVLENVIIDVEGEDNILNINGCENLFIANSEFIHVGISMNAIKNILLKNVIFNAIISKDKYVMEIGAGEIMQMLGCKFINCVKKQCTYRDHYFGIVYVHSNNLKMEVNNSEFVDCYAKAGIEGYIFDGNVKEIYVRNSKFICTEFSCMLYVTNFSSDRVVEEENDIRGIPRFKK